MAGPVVTARLLQVCNVGTLCGGTGACAWSITRALPTLQHTIVCFSEFDAEFQRAAGDCRLLRLERVDDRILERLNPDLVILHNTSRDRAERIRIAPSLSYLHSRGNFVAGDEQVTCSQWLSSQFSAHPPVLWQPVPYPASPRPAREYGLGDQITVGRICTPTRRKWPTALIGFYNKLASTVTGVNWEFVGAPAELEAPLREACRGAVRFWPASWTARRHLTRWDVLLYHNPDLTESFGRTCAEAMLAGCIPVMDCQGGFCEQIASGTTGFLCSETTSFVMSLLQLQDPGLRWVMSHAARNFAEAHFSLGSFRQRFQRLLSGDLMETSIRSRSAPTA